MKEVMAIVEESANSLDTCGGGGGVACQQGADNPGVANAKGCGRCDGQTYLCYTTDILVAVFLGESEIFVEAKTDIVPYRYCELGQRPLSLFRVKLQSRESCFSAGI